MKVFARIFIQEVFWGMEDCDTIRRLEINARFIKLDKDKSTKDHTHFLVVNMNDQVSLPNRDRRPSAHQCRCPNLRTLSLV